MKMVSGKIVATVGLLALMAVAGNLAQAQHVTKPMAVEPRVNTEQLQATADRAAVRIQESIPERRAILDAVRTRNTEQARSLLLRNGFTGKQLEGARIELNDNTGGKGNVEKIKIVIRVSCCPMSIVITLSF
jgi:hypothetical protein